jgi:hypothetical protein
MFPRKVLPVGLAVLVVALPSAAVAAQLKAKDPPKVDGPLSTSPELRRCTRRTERTESGRVIAHFKVCSRYYRFDPDKESDSTSNYGAFWIQVNADATNGWCARAVKVDLSYSGGVRNKAPKPGTREKAEHRERFTTSLIVDADGRADRKASIKNSFDLLPGILRSSLRGNGKTFRLQWKGNSNAKLAFASGLELSWPEDGEAPSISPRVRSLFDRGC